MLVEPKVNWPMLLVLPTPEEEAGGLGLLEEEDEDEEGTSAPKTKLN